MTDAQQRGLGLTAAVAEMRARRQPANQATHDDENEGILAWWHARPAWQKAAMAVAGAGALVATLSAIIADGIVIVFSDDRTTVAVGGAATKLAGRIKT